MVALSVWLDPYGVFNPGKISPSAHYAERFNKLRSYLQQPAKQVFFGSSRMGVTPSQEELLNMSALNTKPSDVLAFLRTMEQEGALPEKVVYYVDLLSVSHSPISMGPQYIHFVPDRSWLKTMKPFISGSAAFKGLRNALTPPSVIFYPDSGHYEIQAEVYRTPDNTNVYQYVENQLEDLKAILAFSLTIITTPIHPERQKLFNDTRLLEILNDTNKIHVKTLHQISIANNMWLDPLHYKPVVAETLLSCIDVNLNICEQALTAFNDSAL
jgi:hypothetical protein